MAPALRNLLFASLIFFSGCSSPPPLLPQRPPSPFPPPPPLPPLQPPPRGHRPPPRLSLTRQKRRVLQPNRASCACGCRLSLIPMQGRHLPTCSSKGWLILKRNIRGLR